MKKGHTHCHDQATVEIKSDKTISDDFFKNISLFAHCMNLADNSHILQPHLVYGGMGGRVPGPFKSLRIILEDYFRLSRVVRHRTRNPLL